MSNRLLRCIEFKAASLLPAFAATLTYSAAHAHHSGAQYDSKQTVTINGVVKRYEWANPHVYLFVEETTDAGKKVEWQIEGAPPAIMRRMGWSPDTFHVGDSVTASGSPTRNPDTRGLFPRAIMRGGSDNNLFALQDIGKLTVPKATPKTPSFAGTWSMPVSIQVYAQVASPAASKLTKEGADALKRYDEKTSPTSNCIPFPAPMFMVTPDLKRITLSAGEIQIESELDGVRRTIYLNRATHDGATPSIQGHSIGRLEGNSLVIDTTHFAYYATGNGGGSGIGPGLPSSAQKHLVERLTLDADGTSLAYHFELTDPEYLAVPRTGDIQWTLAASTQFVKEKCDLDNARRFTKE